MAFIDPSTLNLNSPFTSFGDGTVPANSNAYQALFGVQSEPDQEDESTPLLSFPSGNTSAPIPAIMQPQAGAQPAGQGDYSSMTLPQLQATLSDLQNQLTQLQNEPMTAQERQEATMDAIAQVNPVKAAQMQIEQDHWSKMYQGRGESTIDKIVAQRMAQVLTMQKNPQAMDQALKTAKANIANLAGGSNYIGQIPDTVIASDGTLDMNAVAQIQSLAQLPSANSMKIDMNGNNQRDIAYQKYLRGVHDNQSYQTALSAIGVAQPPNGDWVSRLPATFDGNEDVISKLSNVPMRGSSMPTILAGLRKNLATAVNPDVIQNGEQLRSLRTTLKNDIGVDDDTLDATGYPNPDKITDPTQLSQAIQVAGANGTQMGQAQLDMAQNKANISDQTMSSVIQTIKDKASLASMKIDQTGMDIVGRIMSQVDKDMAWAVGKKTLQVIAGFKTYLAEADAGNQSAQIALLDGITQIDRGGQATEFGVSAQSPLVEFIHEKTGVTYIPKGAWKDIRTTIINSYKRYQQLMPAVQAKMEVVANDLFDQVASRTERIDPNIKEAVDHLIDSRFMDLPNIQ